MNIIHLILIYDLLVSHLSLSIQGQVSDALNRAATGLVDLGFHVVGATGNHGEDACEFSPAVIAPNSSIISVGATDDEDQVAEFSNYGDCVSLVAPGVNIVSVDFGMWFWTISSFFNYWL